VLDVLDSAFAAFKDLQRELAADESCACGACRSIHRLDLKVIAHHGRFVRHAVGGRAQIAGVDVVLAHRLLKNGVTGSRAYVLLTDAMLRWLGLESNDLGLVARVESYEHLGAVQCFVRPLDAVARTVPLPDAADPDLVEALTA
jgi:hypothetical protein